MQTNSCFQDEFSETAVNFRNVKSVKSTSFAGSSKFVIFSGFELFLMKTSENYKNLTT